MKVRQYFSKKMYQLRQFIFHEQNLIRWMKIKHLFVEFKPDKKAFLVVGPESHGTHLVTDILTNAGCIGHAGNHVPWQPDNKVLRRGLKKPWQSDLPTDLQPWDKQLPTNENPIVWRRSIPHGKKWVNITLMIDQLKLRNYEVIIIVVNRDTYSGLQSQLKWQHIKNIEKGKANINRAYLHIFDHILNRKNPFIMVSYEALANYPKAQDFFLKQLELKLPKRRWPIYDGNLKWHDVNKVEALQRFPEGWYPPIKNEKSYFEKVEKGYKKMQQSKVVFSALARDVIKSLPKIMAKIEALGKLFQDYKVIIYENDSTDGTKEMLLYWQRVNDNVTVISEALNDKKWEQIQEQERTLRMAYYRNQYLDYIRKNEFDFDYSIVLDMDIPLGFSYDGIAHSFGHDNWDVMSSNGILGSPVGNPINNPIYFDAFAFLPEDETQKMPIEAINALKFKRGEDLIAVRSAFGGLAIYTKAAIFSTVKYSGETCEHIPFHLALREKGFDKQFINPSQIVLYS